jgi:hypothetical protein
LVVASLGRRTDKTRDVARQVRIAAVDKGFLDRKFLSVASASFRGMSSNGDMDRDAVSAAFDVLDATLDRVEKLDFAALSTHEVLGLLELLERVRQRLSTPPPSLMAAAAAKAVHGTVAAPSATALKLIWPN